MKPLILSFFAVLLGYSFFFDKDDEIKLRNVDQISLESNSTMPERGDSVTLYAKRLPNTPEYILRIAKPEDYLFTKQNFRVKIFVYLTNIAMFVPM